MSKTVLLKENYGLGIYSLEQNNKNEIHVLAGYSDSDMTYYKVLADDGEKLYFKLEDGTKMYLSYFDPIF